MSIDWEQVARAHTPALRIAVLEAYDEFEDDHVTPTEIAAGAGVTRRQVERAAEQLRLKSLLRPAQQPTAEQRFWRFVEVADGEDPCWLWKSTSCKPGGYGNFNDGEKAWNAHRFSYELLVGPIPDGCDLDHLCRTRSCVNPDHLEPTSHQENIRRGETGEVQRTRHRGRTHCRRGHELTPENTRHVIVDGYPLRICRACKRLSAAKQRAKRQGSQLEQVAA